MAFLFGATNCATLPPITDAASVVIYNEKAPVPAECVGLKKFKIFTKATGPVEIDRATNLAKLRAAVVKGGGNAASITKTTNIAAIDCTDCGEGVGLEAKVLKCPRVEDTSAGAR
jgi:hypothetical protein